MFSYKRADRVREVMHEEISAIIRDDVKDPGVGFVTVTAVNLTDNLRYANVYVSPMGDEKEMAQTFKGICRATAFIRKQLGKKMRIRFLPEIVFKLDHTSEESDKINRILHSLEKPQPDDPEKATE